MDLGGLGGAGCKQKIFKKVAYTGPSESALPIQYMCRNLREEENQLLTFKLQERVRLLKSLSIEIGSEVRYQNQYLNRFDDDLDKTDGLLGKAMNRVSQLTRSAQYYYFVYLALFSLACFVMIWCFVTFR